MIDIMGNKFFFFKIINLYKYKKIGYYLIIIFMIIQGVKCETSGAVISSYIISNNSIDLRNERINGDIDVKNKLVCGSIQIEDSEIDGNLLFGGSIFQNCVSIRNTTILGKSYFNNSLFYDQVDFEKSRFSDFANFRDSTFFDMANFKNASFDEANFVESIFSDDALFSRCNFSAVSKFNGANFNKYVTFADSRFYHMAFFSETTYKGYALFERAKFYYYAYFGNAFMSEDVDFFETMFREDAHFSNLKALKEVDFSKSDFSKKANFRDARFSGYANFKNASFQNLILNGAIFNQFYLPWKNVKGKLDCDESLYLHMISTYKDLGLFDDADDCYYYFKNNYRQSYKFNDLIEPILGELYGWGVKPLNTIKWSIIFILIFGLYFWLLHILNNLQCGEGRSDLPETKYSESHQNGTVQSIDKDSTDLHVASFFSVVWSTFLSLTMCLIFSARIYASALTSIIEGPSLHGTRSNIAKLEKLLAHLMAFLFLIAISKTILREII
ncbi:MAG: pentapeptide repeat-containing protein [Methanothrix sp.]|nr:pentapeptide repeat-containing protein [Methanothrix sp.]